VVGFGWYWLVECRQEIAVLPTAERAWVARVVSGSSFDWKMLWDEARNNRNRRKHGVDFQVATLAFDDPNHLSDQDRLVDGDGALADGWSRERTSAGVPYMDRGGSHSYHLR
jgi:uncharacterized DUF497 family protein